MTGGGARWSKAPGLSASMGWNIAGKVRRKPSYGQLLGDWDLVFGVERSDVVSGEVLVVDTGQVRAHALVPSETAAVTPARVAKAIQSALAAGWTADAPRAPFSGSLLRDST
jgi:hypothetical protein